MRRPAARTIGTRHPGRRGAIAIEALLVLPILLVILLALIEFSAILLARQQLLSASREGARVAAIGGDQQEVEEAVLRSLGNGAVSSANIEVVLTDENGQPLASGEPVEVTVTIPAEQITPDLLRIIGFSIEGQPIIGRSVMRKE